MKKNTKAWMVSHWSHCFKENPQDERIHFNDAGASLASVYDGLRVKFVLVPPTAVGSVSAANLSDHDAVLQLSEESR